ncbi:MAG TPA: hypothetical protein VGI38_07940 [Puia sp.]
MAEKRAFYRSRIFYVLSGVLLIILTIGFFIWRNYKYKLVNKKLDNLVTGKSKGLYQLSYRHLIIDEALGNISAEDVALIPDSVLYQKQSEEKTAPESLFYIRIPKLIISGVKTPKALLNKEISAHIIRIENADIQIRMGKSKTESHPDFKSILASEQYRQLLGKLNSIKADSVVLENARLSLMDKDSKKIRCRAEGLSIRFAGISIDSSKQKDSSRMLFSDEQAIECRQLEIPTKNNIYDLKISGLDYNSRKEQLHTAQIRLIPSQSEEEFANANKHAKDRFNISIGQMNIVHLDRQSLLRQEFVADSMILTDASIKIFRDKSKPHDSVDRTDKFPQQEIMRLSLPVYIKKILIRDSYIEYKEKNDKSDSSGKVAFFHVNASLINVTNRLDSIRRNNQMRLHYESRFLNVSSFTADINMRLNDSRGHFHLNAKLGEMEAVTLNPLLKPMALAELDKGKIHSLEYQMDATNTQAKGTLYIKYEDLKIKLLKKDEDKNKYKTKVLPTLAAGVVLKDSNPLHDKMRIGHVDYNRDIYRSIFNLMWKSLFSGIKQVAL